MNFCWENYSEDGQITKLWPDGSLDSSIILTDTISLDGNFLLLKKLASYPSMTWLVIQSYTIIFGVLFYFFFFPLFLTEFT